MGLKLVVFDLDGTLLASRLAFDAVRTEIGLPPGSPIIEAMAAMTCAERKRADAILLRHEAEAADRSTLMPGAAELLEWLRSRNVKMAVLTRNSRASICRAVERHGLAFDAAITREDNKPKPSPDGVRILMEGCGAGPAETIVVGDYRFDIEAGASAGVRTIALVAEPKDWAAGATWIARTLDEVRAILARVAAET
jgi:HAD superfamily hydrolase (TIGR01509 family)